MNLFKVENISVDIEKNETSILWYKAKFDTVVETSCKEHGILFSRLKMYSVGVSPNPDFAIRMAIQQQLDFTFEFKQEIFEPKCNCNPFQDKVTYNFSSVAEPWRSLLGHLFQNKPFTLPSKN